MSKDRIEDVDPHNRRRFFLEGLGRALRPVADYLEEKLPEPRQRTVLRPPGALDEDLFLDHCHRCGSCVEACPAGAIRQYQSEDGEQSGTPHIDPDVAPCVLCDALACMNACPSGALVVVERSDIAIGLAEVYPNVCLLAKGHECGLCAEKCPIGPEAIRITDYGQVEVLDAGCVGCGVCQHHCPTTPKAIVVNIRS
ncbi:MAG: 4Fe-4S dicluster domain-containing protein [Phycisphaerae bacterium]|nr:4Fe-4S dicluster domain-containing protein [Phycisphaerae bacterium]